MLVQRDFGAFMPQNSCLMLFRRQVENQLKTCSCKATRERVLLAVNEIIANVLRHAQPHATDISVDFFDHDGEGYCVICDDGGSFDNFRDYWNRAEYGFDPLQGTQSLGLCMIKRLWPQAFYIKRTQADPYNKFVLPLSMPVGDNAPYYFRPKFIAAHRHASKTPKRHQSETGK